MHALQTLVLSCEHLEAVLPVLDLAALPTLAYLILDHVYPQRLTLPQQCSLDFRYPSPSSSHCQDPGCCKGGCHGIVCCEIQALPGRQHHVWGCGLLHVHSCRCTTHYWIPGGRGWGL